MLGHSFGGHVALEYALRYPEHISHLVLMDTGGDSRWPRENAPELLARRGFSPQKVELVRRFFHGDFAPKEFFSILMRIGDAYSSHPSLWLPIRDMIHGEWRFKLRPEAMIFASRTCSWTGRSWIVWARSRRQRW